MRQDNGELPAVAVEDLSFIYPPPRRIEALKRVNLTIGQGEFVALIGQNGSGKTTLAKCISGFLRPTGGALRVCGREMSRVPPGQQARYVGYVFQNPDHQLFKDSVLEDVAFGLKNLRVPDEEIAPRVEGLLQALDLEKHGEVHPHRLAKGDRQRLAIASIVALEPPVLIIDEPTTGQDPQRAREVMNLLAELNGRLNTTIIVITHAMELVAEYASRVVALCRGEILADGPARDVFRQTELLAQTYVEPPVVVQLGLSLGLEPLPLTVPEAARAVLGVLRP